LKHYSRSQVTKAGKKLKNKDYANESELKELMDVLSFWRLAHEQPLNEAFKLLKSEALKIDKKAIFGRRLKRYSSIVKKITRFETMQLGNMRDIGGCRAIVTGQSKLEKLVRNLRKDNRFRGDNGSIRKRDYISNPKSDGYRSYHLIGMFSNQAQGNRFIEIQVRTRIQHDWATTLEIVDLFTGQALKSNVGKTQWKNFFKNVGKQFAVMDSISGFLNLSAQRQFEEYSKRVASDESVLESCENAQHSERNVNAIQKLNGFSQSLKFIEDEVKEVKSEGYVLIELDLNERLLKTTMFPETKSKEAEEIYTSLETMFINNPDTVIALISTSRVNDIRQAYPNFFGDSTEFIRYLHLINRIEAERARPNMWMSILKKAGFQ
jgi:ppGpp synthetase/RelA/SpoT-type nucleotidyltranferase|tara:strand:+ start:69314 stop:70450 length:1137 start_codon:yes stop_codon:yes gene_type:complete